MNTGILIAAIVLSATAAGHVSLGNGRAMGPLRAAPLPRISHAATEIIWHAVTITLVALAAALFWLAWNPNPALLVFASLMQVGFALLFLWIGITRMQSPWVMPQWVVFLGVPALCFWAAG